MKSSEVLIIGGGVIGLMTALELAQAGVQVRVLEQGAFVKEASWAGGGIVSPLYPWRYSSAVTALASWSQSAYSHLSQELKTATGIDPELRQKGLLILAVDDEQAALDWAQQYQRPLCRINNEQVKVLEPGIAVGHGALWMPEVASIRNPRLGQALLARCQQMANIQLHEHSAVTGFCIANGLVSAVESGSQSYRAEQVVLCAGAWTGQLAQFLQLALPIEPVKGQMLVLQTEQPSVERVVLGRGRYLIPRNDGLLLVGSTLEYEGFDKTPQEQARQSLFQSACELLPSLDKAKVLHHWAGLRPGSPNGIPWIGQMPGWHNLHINAGHFRNGLVLAPASCGLMADLLLQRVPRVNPAPYQPQTRLNEINQK
nr:glycine oxidase ThiO [Balneatrix alpica]